MSAEEGYFWIALYVAVAAVVLWEMRPRRKDGRWS